MQNFPRFQVIFDDPHRFIRDGVLRLIRRCTDMMRAVDARQRNNFIDEFRLWLARLMGKHIQPGFQLFILDARGQSLLVDHATSTGVDQVRSRSHAGDERLIDQMLRLLVGRHVNTDNIAGRGQFKQIVAKPDPRLMGFFW